VTCYVFLQEIPIPIPFLLLCVTRTHLGQSLQLFHNESLSSSLNHERGCGRLAWSQPQPARQASSEPPLGPLCACEYDMHPDLPGFLAPDPCEIPLVAGPLVRRAALVGFGLGRLDSLPRLRLRLILIRCLLRLSRPVLPGFHDNYLSFCGLFIHLRVPGTMPSTFFQEDKLQTPYHLRQRRASRA
jgi:hypothetical protein